MWRGGGEAFLLILTTRSFLQHQWSTGEQLQKCRKCFSSLRLIIHYKMPRQSLLPLWLPARHPELLQSQQFGVFPIECDHCKAPFFDRTPIPPLFSIQHLTFPSALISIYVTPKPLITKHLMLTTRMTDTFDCCNFSSSPKFKEI